MTAQPSGFLYPQDLPDAIQRLKTATAGDQRAAIALDVLLLELESRDSENLRELKAMERRAREMNDDWSSNEPSSQAAGVTHYILNGET